MRRRQLALTTTYQFINLGSIFSASIGENGRQVSLKLSWQVEACTTPNAVRPRNFRRARYMRSRMDVVGNPYGRKSFHITVLTSFVILALVPKVNYSPRGGITIRCKNRKTHQDLGESWKGIQDALWRERASKGLIQRPYMMVQQEFCYWTKWR